MQHSGYRKDLLKLAFTVAIAVILFVFGFSGERVEQLYSRGLYSYTSLIQRSISAVLPFPVGDFLYLSLIFYAGLCIYRFYKKVTLKKLKKTDRLVIPMQVIRFFLVLYIVFKLLWGLNYSRPSISDQLGIENAMYTTPELVSLGRYLILRLNQVQPLRVKKTNWQIEELAHHAKLAYTRMEQKNPFFKYQQPSVKSVLNSWAITKIGIEGYYNPLSGEANVNMRLPVTSLPFVACHEIAHQLGVSREDEANLVGYLTAIHSEDVNFRYSGYYAILKSVLFEIRIKSPEDYEILYNTINAVTIGEFKRDREFWRKYNNEMFGYLDIAFDRFLKLNNQRKGIDSYQDIVLWLYNYHKKELVN